MLREAAAFVVLFAVAAVAYTWPLLPESGSSYLAFTAAPPAAWFQDPLMISWMLAWTPHALLTHPTGLFDANVLYPVPNALRFSEHLLGTTPLTVPLALVTDNPLHLFNGVILASYALGGAAAALWLRELGLSRLGALAGGALFVFGPLRTAWIAQAYLLATWAMPLTLLFLHRLLRTGTRGAGAGFACFLLVQTLTSLHFAFAFGLAVALYVPLDRVLHRAAGPRFHGRALAWGAAAAVLAGVTYLPYLDARERFGLGRPAIQTMLLSSTVEYYVRALFDPRAYLTPGPMAQPGQVGFGPGGWVLLAASLLRARRGDRLRADVRLFWVLGLVLAVLSLGPRMRFGLVSLGVPGPYALLAALPGWGAMRHPKSLSLVVGLFAAALGGIGADAVLARRRGWAFAAALLAVGLLVAADCRRPGFHVVRRLGPQDRAGVDRWLAAQPGDFAIAEVPYGPVFRNAEYMVRSTRHWKRLVNAYVNIQPPGPGLAPAVQQFPAPPSLQALHAVGVRYVVVHDDLLPRPLCADAVRVGGPWIAPRFAEGPSCVFEVLGAPRRPTPASTAVPMAGARLSASDGSDAAPAADGRLDTHWRVPVDPSRESWLAIDFGAPRTVQRVRLRLGRHFGDYLRSARVETSDDGIAWTVRARMPVVAPPIADLRRDPEGLAVDLELPPVTARHLRLVQPAVPELAFNAIVDYWPYWGVHEVEVYAP